jgi:hypothetical protein
MKKPTKKTAKRKVKAGGARRTGNKVATLAGRVLEALDYPRGIPIYVMGLPVGLTVGQVRSLAASCLAQDEHRGTRAKP